jgi:CsoR family transcriptional regulator, copper-sensing transcriptional repressor
MYKEEKMKKNIRKKEYPNCDCYKKDLEKRLNKISGQIIGISKMIEEDRYCQDILNQLEAAKSALRQVQYEVLKTHMNTCIKDEIMKGNDKVIEETFNFIKHLR